MNATLLKVWKTFTGCFLAGLFAVLPLVVTVAIVAWVVDFLVGMVGPNTWVGSGLRMLGMRFTQNSILAQLVGWAIVLGAIFLIGMFVQMKLRSVLISWINAIFHRLPVIGSVYGTASQFVGMLNKKDDNQLAAMSVVYCTFGAEGGCGLLALMPSRERYSIGGREYCAVYIPTSPVPMTGGLLFVPAEGVIPIEMSVDKLMSIYLSMGVTAPQLMPRGL